MRNKHSVHTRNRSGKMPCDICHEPNYLDVHHIGGKNIPNAEHRSNLANLCQNCHRRVHEGNLIIIGHILGSDGYSLVWAKAGELSVDDIPFATPYIIKQKYN